LPLGFTGRTVGVFPALSRIHIYFHAYQDHL